MKQTWIMIWMLILSAVIYAGEKQNLTVPETAKNPQEIRKSMEAFKGFGYVQSAHFDNWGKEIIVLWYCPFSGRAACYLYGYYYDPETKKWIRFLNDFVEGTHDLSVTIPCKQEFVVFSDTKGVEVRKIDISKVPRKKWDEKEKKAKPSNP